MSCRRRRVLSSSVLAVVLPALGCSSTDILSAAGGGADAGTPQDIAHLLTVDHVSVNQGAAVTLVEDALVVPSGLQVVPGRPALVRVHARVPPRTTVPRLTAELRVHVPGREDAVVVDGPRTVVSPMELGDLTTTFNFDLTGAQIAPDASLSVVFRDPTGADPTTARYPAAPEAAAEVEEGRDVEPAPTLPMNVGPYSPTLRVRLVPVRYTADGSNRLPPLDAATVESYKKGLYRMYPVANVELTVRDPFDWSLVVKPDGEGWAQLLDAVIETRSDDDAPDDVYYVGIFNPAATEREYCRQGCILGVAPPAITSEVGLRAAMVVGYPTERAHGTMAQEIAHAMRRLHAPCGGPSGIDRNYPYPGAAIGTWGWDIVDRRLVDPGSQVFDFMSYCNPVWVSDYTFAGLYDHLAQIERAKNAGTVQPKRTYHVGKDGSVRPGPTISVRTGVVEGALAPPAETFVLEGADRRPVGKVRGSFRPTPSIGGGWIVAEDAVPEGTLRKARFARAIARQ